MNTFRIMVLAVMFSASALADPITFMKVGGVYAIRYSETEAQIKIRVDAIDGQWVKAQVNGGTDIWINMALVLNVEESSAP
jgi:hypothetical protein